MKKSEYKFTNPHDPFGVGLRAAHIDYIINEKPSVGWFEVHSENHYASGGPAINNLIKIRENYPISLHSVGNSLGSQEGVNGKHLQKLQKLIEIIDPFLVSDHISWSAIAGKDFNDLLPLPYNKTALAVISDNVSKMQDILKRQLLVENPSTYLSFKNPEMDEVDFINQLVQKTGCGLLLDVNNIYVSSQNNQDFQPCDYIKRLDQTCVKEIHLAGHSKTTLSNGMELLIDTHNNMVCDAVWEIYQMAIKRFGTMPTLIEWDQDIPEFNILMNEAKKAKTYQ